MTVLRLMGLIVLAGLTIGIFAVFYPHMQGLSASKQAKATADRIDVAINHVLITGNSESVEFDIPKGYRLRFKENRLVMGDVQLPEKGYSKPIEGPMLTPGSYEIRVKINEDMIEVEVLD